jgi:hypothetical protein
VIAPRIDLPVRFVSAAVRRTARLAPIPFGAEPLRVAIVNGIETERFPLTSVANACSTCDPFESVPVSNESVTEVESGHGTRETNG